MTPTPLSEQDLLAGFDMRPRLVSGGQQYLPAGSVDSHLTNPARNPDQGPSADRPIQPGLENKPI
jgi:hypothetical protein